MSGAVKHQPATPLPTTEAKLRDVAHYLDGIGTAFAEDSAAAIDAAIKERRKLIEALRVTRGAISADSREAWEAVNALLRELGEAS